MHKKKSAIKRACDFFWGVLLSLLLLSTATYAYQKNISNSFAKDDGSALYLTALRYDPYPAEPGHYVDVWLKVENKGSVDAKDITITLKPSYPFSLDASENPKTHFGKILSHQSVLVHYKMRVADDAVKGENTLYFTYESADGTIHGEGQTPIFVETSNALLSVTSVSSTPSLVGPGQEATIRISFRNDADAYLKFISVTLELYAQATTTSGITTLELPFTPVNGGNQQYIALLKPDEERTLSFTLLSNPTAESKPYKIPLTVTYYDSLGRNYTRALIVGMVVGAVPELSVHLDEYALSQEKTAGDVSIRFVNKGVTDIKFLTTTLFPSERFTIISSPEVYVGNIDSDDYQTATFKLHLSKEQEKMLSSGSPSVPLDMRITYLDANNRAYEKNISLSILLYTDEQLGVEKNGTGTILFVVILVLLGAYLLYHRWEKKKR